MFAGEIATSKDELTNLEMSDIVILLYWELSGPDITWTL
jgi:hypothetical protein